jgi:cystathionine beta-lyase
MLNSLELFGIGASWGGYESLIIPAFPDRYRTATPWNAAGPLLRLHAGLESPADLIADLEHGFNQLADQGTNSIT